MYEKEVKEVELNFIKWLEQSNINENDFNKKNILKNGEFEIRDSKDGEYNKIILGYMKDSFFMQIGEPILYKISDKQAEYDVALLLLYIAEKFEKSYRNGELFQKVNSRYFYNKVKSFIGEKMSF